MEWPEVLPPAHQLAQISGNANIWAAGVAQQVERIRTKRLAHVDAGRLHVQADEIVDIELLLEALRIIRELGAAAATVAQGTSRARLLGEALRSFNVTAPYLEQARTVSAYYGKFIRKGKSEVSGGSEVSYKDMRFHVTIDDLSDPELTRFEVELVGMGRFDLLQTPVAARALADAIFAASRSGTV